MEIAGPDGGQGGKYLFLPPGYAGKVPEGYFIYRCPTYSNWVVLRVLGGVPAIKTTRIYPLTEATAPEVNEFINIAEQVFNTVHANDFSFFEEVNELIQEEPTDALDAERTGQLAAIGLVVGQPFAPDARLRSILSVLPRSEPAWHARSPTSLAIPTRSSTAHGGSGSSEAAMSSCATEHGCSTPAPRSTTWLRS